MIHVEFTIHGVPISQRSQNTLRLREWRERVRSAAIEAWKGRPPLMDSIRVSITFYHEGESFLMDEDNLRKPIQDAMNQVVYLDDIQVVDGTTHKRSIDGQYRVRGVSLVLLEAFSRSEPFVHVQIATPDDPAQLPEIE